MLKIDSILHINTFIIILLSAFTIFKPDFDQGTINSFLIFASLLFLTAYLLISRINFNYIEIVFIFSLVFFIVFFTATYYASLIILTCFFIRNAINSKYINKSEPFFIKKTQTITSITTMLLVISLFSLKDSHLGRYSSLNGDPNYTALIYIFFLLIISKLNLGNNLLNKLIMYPAIIIIIIITQSRTALLGLIAFYITKKFKKSSSLIVSTIFLLSIFSQGLAYIALINNFEGAEAANDFGRFFVLIDKSNYLRLLAFADSINFIITPENYLGSSNYFNSNIDATHIPHNWFLQIAISNGLPVAVATSIYFISTIPKIKYENLPIIAYILVFSTNLSWYPLSTIFLIYSLILHREILTTKLKKV